jgi:hypothetical protein
LVADVSTIGGGLPDFPDVAFSVGMDSVPVASVSMFAMQRGAKKFLVATSINVAGSTAFFEVPPASEFQCLFSFACTMIVQSDKGHLNYLGHIYFVCIFVSFEQHVKSVTCRQHS